ncbi:hypothetical protein RHGRI_027045 [Rhododendron griersonianum]|uniref:RNase H type-1 domain-containing protein n=1 Tax=Rhododendron griersonianum TaxID=479676 RepID=A0AAV6IZ02_9ERIC|nr:hypothetical protein RHGRI_027045 [Rhododendron griersonianum]
MKGILVETDSFATTQLLHDENPGNHELNNEIFYCMSMLQMFGSEVKHVFWKANSCSDMLASLNLQQDNLVIFPTLRNCLGKSVYEDSLWKKLPRTRFMMLILRSSLL